MDLVGSNFGGSGGPSVGGGGVAKKELSDACNIMSASLLFGAGETSDKVLFLPLEFGGVDDRLGFVDTRVEVLLFFSLGGREGWG